MPLESASNISQLNASWPVGSSDTPSILDDHLRLIKNVLIADAFAASLANGSTAKTTPDAGDLLLIADSAASYARKKLAWSDLQAAIQSQTYSVANAGGTADAITATYSPTITALTHGMILYVRAGAANATTTPTFTPNSGVIAAKTIVKGAGTALEAGDIAGSGHWIELQYDAILDKWVLLNPTSGVISTPPQFDSSTRAATTAFTWGQGLHFQNATGIGLTTSTTLTVAQAGHWFETQAAGLTITLPPLASCPAGMVTYTIRALSAFTLKGNGSESIKNLMGVVANTLSVLAGESITVVGNGTEDSWYVVHEGMSGSLFTSSLGAQGYQKVGSTIIQRGTAFAGQNGTAYTNNFPIAFPTACRALVAQHLGADVTVNIILDSTTATQFLLRSNYASINVPVSYIAIGE